MMIDKSNCGIGAIANINGIKTHEIIEDALKILQRMEHRGGMFDDNTGDGAGILTEIPHELFEKEIENLPDNYSVGMFFLPTNKEKYNLVVDVIEEIAKEMDINIISYRDVPTSFIEIGKLAKDTEPVFKQLFVDVIDEVKLYLFRRKIEKTLYDDMSISRSEFYVVSLSNKTICYKGLLTPDQLSKYYLDLLNPLYKSCFSIIHQRFSTNTSPTWDLAQPFKYLAHNGEINTINGNINWMNARKSNYKDSSLKDAFPVTNNMQSDTSNLDAAIEFYKVNGHDLTQVISVLVPPAYENDVNMNKDLKEYYEQMAVQYEPWDGPASLVMSDGDKLVATLDKNGLRPSRYIITKDNQIILSSEVGVLDIEFSNIIESNRLEAGKLLVVDFKKGKVISDEDIKSKIIDENKGRYRYNIKVNERDNNYTSVYSESDYEKYINMYRYTKEDINLLIKTIVDTKSEAISSYPYCVSLAAFNKGKNLLFDYFKQKFAQVTNPPLDSIREELIFSLSTFIKTSSKVFKYMSPLISQKQYNEINSFNIELISLNCNSSFEERLEEIDTQIEASQKKIYIISDENSDNITLPVLLVASYVHHKLVDLGRRKDCHIIVASKEMREATHYAMLISYGVDLIYPYQVYEIISKEYSGCSLQNYYLGIDKAIKKIMSKVGISSISSYRGAKTFEIVGLDKKLTRKFFPDTSVMLSVKDLSSIEEEYRTMMTDENNHLWKEYSFKKDGLDYYYSPGYSNKLFKALKNNDYSMYKEVMLEENEKRVNIRDFLRIKGNPISIDKVESTQSIIKSFVASAISFGAISEQAHKLISRVFNDLGANSNCGEGGEDPNRYYTNVSSKVKQVSSGRFGVTTDYLIDCEEIQIKMAQGAKPGEGGHLPGKKINDIIGRVRCTVPGIDLVSPPPHHDIYSIEDLAQLIYDLKQINPKATVSVKLAALSSVGIVANGVIKAGADKIVICGYNGGTGASPISSLKYTGIPVELGLKEAQEKLTSIGVRDNVMLQVDGQIRNGKDIVLLSALGADEFGFGTSLLIAIGCIACRKCQTNTCPVGICTQDVEKHKSFKGTYETLKNYLLFVAQDVRECLASIGVKSLKELKGKLNYLYSDNEIMNSSDLLNIPKVSEIIRNKIETKNDANDYILEEFNKDYRELNYHIRNYDRTFSASISNKLVVDNNEEQVKINTIGYAGQSYGAFCYRGITLNHTGLANDYVGKGLCGGEIIIKSPNENYKVLAGNTILYGATSGNVFINGNVGERFAVRNSGAIAVVEGLGKHGCEYMTGGVVACLGDIGDNFGAGMSGGIAYVYNLNETYVNTQSVSIYDLDSFDVLLLNKLLELHINKTDSELAKEILKKDIIDNFKLITSEYYYSIRKNVFSGLKRR